MNSESAKVETLEYGCVTGVQKFSLFLHCTLVPAPLIWLLQSLIPEPLASACQVTAIEKCLACT